MCFVPLQCSRHFFGYRDYSREQSINPCPCWDVGVERETKEVHSMLESDKALWREKKARSEDKESVGDRAWFLKGWSGRRNI